MGDGFGQHIDYARPEQLRTALRQMVSTRTRYSVIAIPSMLMMMIILYYLWRTIHGITGLELDDIFPGHRQKMH